MTPFRKGVIAATAITGSLMLAAMPGVAHATTDSIDYAIDSPYADVDWGWTQYKAGFHNHTTESDGGNSLREMIDQAYALGFNVYAATDHNFHMEDWVGDYKEGPLGSGEQPKANYYYTQAEVDAMLAGEGRDGKPGLLGVPNTDEQSIADHLNTFWTPWNNSGSATLESKIEHVDGMTGQPSPLMHINHPGRYYGGSTTKLGPNGEDLGGLAATDPAKVARYVGLFEQYPDSLVGMEIVNKVSDGDSYSDRILWDSVLAETMPERNVYGFSNDDAHSTGALGYDYNQLLMPELSEQAVHDAMTSGAWYSSALVAKRELGSGFKGDRTEPAPTISSIAVDQTADSITIQGAGYHRIEWIADGKVIATGNTLDLDDVSASVDNYVRAQLIGDNGISFTNAFGVTMNTTGNDGEFLSDSEAAQAAVASVGRTTAAVEVVRAFGASQGAKRFDVAVTTPEGTTMVKVDAVTGAIL
ncbi:hypothetical protein [Raineyella sp. LH-20]|uniref:hypothetical protein n=1 Tax=Raineyella sp. LH-20 TaxID=3081204 RepID=UPI002953AAB7|nr:hypothetical protein [Raineyella sp. LH-20]WOP19777.1 hypothetical protein R0146_05765 [Raineyella sp. LH-20]